MNISKISSGLSILTVTGALIVAWDCQDLRAEESVSESVSLAISVGEQKQLFIDDALIEPGQDVSFHVTPPRKTNEIILKADRPWEYLINWFSVVEDQGVIDKQAKYRMWYETYVEDGYQKSPDDTAFCYAESRDGIHWTKPNLGLFEYQGNTNNNILFRLIGADNCHTRVHGAEIFIDPTAPPESRYKGLSRGTFNGFSPPHRIAGMYSADGLNWTRYSKPVCDNFADSQYSGFWDSDLGKYVLFGRVGGRGRALGRSESLDFEHFPSLSRVLQANDQDKPATDLYNPAAMKYPFAPGVYFMFPSIFDHRADTLEIGLAVSRDSIHWSRPDQETPFIPISGSKKDFDGTALYMGQGMLTDGDELWFYYSGSPLGHSEGSKENLQDPANKRVYSRVVAKRDRFVAVESDAGKTSFITKPVTFDGNILKVNTDVAKGGSLRVGLLDEDGNPIPGRSIDQCVPITGDQMDALVLWNGTPKPDGDVTSQAGQPVRIQFEIDNAKVYGFRFTVGYSGPERDH